MMLVLTDDWVRACGASLAVSAMREAVLAAHAGELAAPPRAAVSVGDHRLTVTAGALAGRWYGFRSYDATSRSGGADQLVVLHDEPTGELRAIAVGTELGGRRTGAIGGVAVDALARADAATLGVVGTGTQAWTQVWAAAAARSLTEVTVFSRTPEQRAAFAQRVVAELGVPARAVESAAAAVAERDVVVLATTSREPVIEAAALAPGTHVSTVGPKQRGRAEFGPDLAERAGAIVTDSLAQAASYDPPMLLAGTPAGDRMVSLGAVLAGERPGRRSRDEITLFCSVGLAGTEVFLLDRLAADGTGQAARNHT